MLGSCLVSFHFLCAILSTSTVEDKQSKQRNIVSNHYGHHVQYSRGISGPGGAVRSPVSLALCCVPSTSIFPHGPDGEICYGERLPAQTERTDIYAPADTHIKRGESRMEFFRLADSWLNLIPWRMITRPTCVQ